MGTLVFQATLGGSVNLLGPNIATNINFTLPSADGTNGQALTTNGSGVLAFSTVVSAPAGSNTQVQFNNSGAFGASSSLTWNGSVLTSAGFSGPLNGTVGATTANTGNFTTLTTSSTVTLNGGTASGVTYLNGSKVLTSGSALTFDGTNLGLGGTTNTYGSQTTLTLSGTNVSRIDFRSNSVFTGTILSYQSITEGLRISTEAGYPITFYPAGTEAMRIGVATGGVGAVGIGYTSLTSVGNNGLAVLGNVGIGTNGPNRKLYVQSDDSATGGNVVAVRNANSTAGAFINFLAGGSNAPSMGAKGDALVFTADGYNGTEWGRFSSGNLGVGISSPTGRLAVGGANTTYDTNVFGQVLVQSTTAYNATPRAGIIFSVKYSSGGSYGVGSSIQGYKENSTDGDFSQGILFTTQQNGLAPAERARITSDGNFLVNTTSATTLTTNCIVARATQGTLYVAHENGNTGSNFGVFVYDGTTIGSISQSGTTAVLYNVTSDQRLKENIVDAPEFGSVIDSIQVRSFDWKTDGNHQRAGFIAQELVTVAPEAVYQPIDTDEMMAVDYSKLVPMLVKEIQSLRQRLSAANL